MDSIDPRILERTLNSLKALKKGKESGRGTTACVYCKTLVHKTLSDLKSHLQFCEYAPKDIMSRFDSIVSQTVDTLEFIMTSDDWDPENNVVHKAMRDNLSIKIQ